MKLDFLSLPDDERRLYIEQAAIRRSLSGSFRLVPPPSRLSSLRQDYQAMRDMYLSEPASFDDILTTLATLESRINSTARQGG